MQNEEIPIRELLLLCLGSEDEALWAQFIDRTRRLIANVIINTLRRGHEPDPALVDDLIQDTYLKLFSNNRKYLRGIRNEHENAIWGYLKMAASSTAQDYFRRPEQKAIKVELNEQVLPPSTSVMELIEINLSMDEIDRRLQRLAASPTYKRDKAILYLKVQGYTASEIAAIPHIGLTTKGVEAVLQRLIQYLRESGSEATSSGNDD
jgi:RNA polymerase sigma factor (sigma-70 family)